MSVLDELVALSKTVGRPEMDCAILGEGNTSAREDDRSFWIKASGTNLATIERDGFVRVSFETVLGLLEQKNPDADAIQAVYERATLEGAAKRRPSVETLFHAVCLSLPGVSFVAHTHPTAVNGLTCARSYPRGLEGRMYPDEIVWLGVDSVFLPYVNPGVDLALRMAAATGDYMDRYGVSPRIIYMQNHGMVALGANRQAVESTTFTAVKAARVRLNALAAGGVRLLHPKMVGQIAGRPDEAYRVRMATEEPGHA